MKYFGSSITAATALFASLYILVSFTGCHAEQIPAVDIEQKKTVDSSVQNSAEMISNDALARDIEAISNTDTTLYSVYACYPEENRTEYIFQNRRLRSASMIKVFILGYAMEEVSAGRLSLEQGIVLHDYDKVAGSGILAGYPNDTVLDLDTVLRYMITESDNTATNMIIDLLGMDGINEYIKKNDYKDTILQRKMMDFEAAAAGLENFTSVTDLGHFFLRLYNRHCVTPTLNDIMIDYLLGQTDTDCFPLALPDVKIAHKTGELVGLYDDGGIIYNGEHPFILVIMTEGYSSRDNAINVMQDMAAAVSCHADL